MKKQTWCEFVFAVTMILGTFAVLAFFAFNMPDEFSMNWKGAVYILVFSVLSVFLEIGYLRFIKFVKSAR